MTPYELSIAIEAFIEIAEIEAQERLTYVWLGEYYHRIKRLPSLPEILNQSDKKQEPKRMTDDQMLSMAKKLNAQFGGIVVKGETDESKQEGHTPDSL